jgi:hypothetical protein
VGHRLDREYLVEREQHHGAVAASSVLPMRKVHRAREDVVVIDGAPLPSDGLLRLVRSVALQQLQKNVRTQV